MLRTTQSAGAFYTRMILVSTVFSYEHFDRERLSGFCRSRTCVLPSLTNTISLVQKYGTKLMIDSMIDSKKRIGSTAFRCVKFL